MDPVAGRINSQSEQTSLNPTCRNRESLTPNVQLESPLDEDFRKFVPLSSLLYRDTLSVNFDVQSNVQDQHNIDIARGIITPGGKPVTPDRLPLTPGILPVPINAGGVSLLQGAPQCVSSDTSFGQGMDPRFGLPHASPTSSHSLPELAGSAHYHHLSPAQHSFGSVAGHQPHTFDQPMRESEFSTGHGQYNEPTVYDSGEMEVSHGHVQTGLGYSPAGQHRRHSGYDEQQGAMRSHPLPSPDAHHHPQQQWPSTQTYHHTLHARHASADSLPNVRYQVKDPRLLGSLRSSVDDATSSRPASFAPGRYAAGNASSTTTIQNQNLAERLSVGTSPSAGTNVRPRPTTTSPSLTRQSTGSICGTAPMKHPHPTERRILGDDERVETAMETGSADAAVTKSYQSNVTAMETGSVDGDAAAVTKSNKHDGFRLNLNVPTAVSSEDMSDDLVDQIIRGCTMTARRKLNVAVKITDTHQVLTPTDSHQVLTPTDSHPVLTPTDSRPVLTPTDSRPVLTPTDSHPVLTPSDDCPAPAAAGAADFVASEQLLKMSRRISEESDRIKMLEESVKAQTLSQNDASVAVTSSEPCPTVVDVTASTMQSATSVVAACPTSAAATVTAAPEQTPGKSDGTQKSHRGSTKTKAKRLHASRKEKTKEKKSLSKKGKAVIRTADDMNLFLNRARKHDSNGTRRSVMHKIVKPHTSNG